MMMIDAVHTDCSHTVMVVARGSDADMPPLVRCYDVERDLLWAATSRIHDMIGGSGRRININDVLLLYGGCACLMMAESLADAAAAAAAEVTKTDRRIIKERLAGLLSEDQVMIGVTDMTARVDIKIDACRGCMSGTGCGLGQKYRHNSRRNSSRLTDAHQDIPPANNGNRTRRSYAKTGGDNAGVCRYTLDISLEHPVRPVCNPKPRRDLCGYESVQGGRCKT